MNERMMRVPGNHVAEFVTAFAEGQAAPGARAVAPMPNGFPLDSDAVWLVWYYEGDFTLMSMMEVGRRGLGGGEGVVQREGLLLGWVWRGCGSLLGWRQDDL